MIELNRLISISSGMLRCKSIIRHNTSDLSHNSVARTQPPDNHYSSCIYYDMSIDGIVYTRSFSAKLILPYHSSIGTEVHQGSVWSRYPPHACSLRNRACGAHRLSWMVQQRCFAPLLHHPRKPARAQQCELATAPREDKGNQTISRRGTEQNQQNRVSLIRSETRRLIRLDTIS